MHTDPDIQSFDADCKRLPQLNEEAASALPVALDRILGRTRSTAGRGSTVAVIDGGLDWDQGRLTGSRSFLAADYPVRAEANADLPDDFDCANTPYRDGHGSLVTGIINRLAPGADVLALKACNAEGQCPTSSVVKALLYLRNRYCDLPKVDVINMSLGGLSGGGDPLLNAVLKDLPQSLPHTLVVTSVGNDRDAPEHFPANLQTEVPTLMGVAAAKRLEVGTASGTPWELASFNTCATLIAAGIEPFAAPGVRLEWTWKGQPRTLSGTSFAAPIVSAIAARWHQRYPNLDAATLRERIRAGASQQGDFAMAQLPGASYGSVAQAPR